MSAFAIPIVALLACFVYLIVQAIAGAICEARQHRADVELKMALARRGMSADEIVRVVTARRGAASESAPYATETLTPSAAMPPHKAAQAPLEAHR